MIIEIEIEIVYFYSHHIKLTGLELMSRVTRITFFCDNVTLLILQLIVNLFQTGLVN